MKFTDEQMAAIGFSKTSEAYVIRQFASGINLPICVICTQEDGRWFVGGGNASDPMGEIPAPPNIWAAHDLLQHLGLARGPMSSPLAEAIDDFIHADSQIQFIPKQPDGTLFRLVVSIYNPNGTDILVYYERYARPPLPIEVGSFCAVTKNGLEAKVSQSIFSVPLGIQVVTLEPLWTMTPDDNPILIHLKDAGWGEIEERR